MIFKSEGIKGCVCGKDHGLTTRLAVVESGAMSHLDEYLSEYGISGKSVAIYDENTYRAKGLVRPEADFEIILSPEGLHADEHGVGSALEKMPEDADYLIAVGAGTIHDITRYIAHGRGIPFVSCPTAASVDGFCSSVAAMTWGGFKKTFTATAPTLVVADTEVIRQAPMRLGASGFGDMIGKYIALSDWKIANILIGEYLCPEIYAMTLSATESVLAATEGIRAGAPEAFEKLTYGLLMSGIAMQLLGNSRCASGAEHHISHIIEMSPEPLSVSSDMLHGEKVGVGTLLLSDEYHRFVESDIEKLGDYIPASESYIRDAFGDRLAGSIIKENEVDSCKGITREHILEKLDEIRAVVDAIPTKDELITAYDTVGALKSLEELGVSGDKRDMLFEYSPLVRNRLTLMRIRRGAMR
ncbi:MAG: sn-glycerol-1-phosphate dehydrogenase [Clostridia bacterium]|nr:sn-glycerol-1-phosphate dehydrogenase [Clostridia bacterium]